MTHKKEIQPKRLNIDAEKEVLAHHRRNPQNSLFPPETTEGWWWRCPDGIDSSVTVALAAKAVGPQRVQALLMPERDSSSDTLDLSRNVAESCGVAYQHEDITSILDAVGFYRRYDDVGSGGYP